jgi:hypothetical protein
MRNIKNYGAFLNEGAKNLTVTVDRGDIDGFVEEMNKLAKKLKINVFADEDNVFLSGDALPLKKLRGGGYDVGEIMKSGALWIQPANDDIETIVKTYKKAFKLSGHKMTTDPYYKDSDMLSFTVQPA